jgi:hypothetical protein
MPVKMMAQMKTVILAALAVVTSTAAQACNLSDDDFKSLAASPSHLTASEFATLTAARQKAVCDSRAFIAYVDAQKGVINELGPYSTKWVSPVENDRIVAASNAYLERLIRARGR